MRNMYHYPGMTDLDKIRANAAQASLTEVVMVHLHAYSDDPCKLAEGVEASDPRHMIFRDGLMIAETGH